MAEPQQEHMNLRRPTLRTRPLRKGSLKAPKVVKGQQLETLDNTAVAEATPLFSELEMGEFRSRWSNVQTAALRGSRVRSVFVLG
jgi:hypothetical protein